MGLGGERLPSVNVGFEWVSWVVMGSRWVPRVGVGGEQVSGVGIGSDWYLENLYMGTCGVDEWVLLSKRCQCLYLVLTDEFGNTFAVFCLPAHHRKIQLVDNLRVKG